MRNWLDNTEFLVAQYANYTLIILDGTGKSLRETINELYNLYKNNYIK